MKFLHASLLCSMVLAASVSAQERTAGGSLENQMNWSALSAKIDAVRSENTALRIQMNQFVACGKKRMVYAPGVDGIDGEGCLMAMGSSTSTTTPAAAEQTRWAQAGTQATGIVRSSICKDGSAYTPNAQSLQDAINLGTSRGFTQVSSVNIGAVCDRKGYTVFIPSRIEGSTSCTYRFYDDRYSDFIYTRQGTIAIYTCN